MNKRIVLLAVVSAMLLPATEPDMVERQWTKLLGIRTVHVDALPGEGGEAIRAMLIGAVQRTGLFIVTENPENADAYLRGTAEDLIYTDFDRYRNGINVRGSSSGSKREDGDYNRTAGSFGVSDTEEASSRIRKHEATAAVRIVLRTGEVVWSSTQESKGAKYMGSAADVAERIARDLEQACKRARQIERTQADATHDVGR